MSGADDLRAVLRDLPLQTAELLRRADAVLRHVDPAAVRTVEAEQRRISYGVGPRREHERYAWLDAYSTHLVLSFVHGAQLPDPRRLLTRAGPSVRTLRVDEASVLDQRPVRQLLLEARDERLLALGRSR